MHFVFSFGMEFCRFFLPDIWSKLWLQNCSISLINHFCFSQTKYSPGRNLFIFLKYMTNPWRACASSPGCICLTSIVSFVFSCSLFVFLLGQLWPADCWESEVATIMSVFAIILLIGLTPFFHTHALLREQQDILRLILCL
jgi:hypothetical protein